MLRRRFGGATMTPAERYADCIRRQIPGEVLLDAIRRLAVEDFVAGFGSQKEAARMLGVSEATVCRYVQVGVRKRVNATLGQQHLNHHRAIGRTVAP